MTITIRQKALANDNISLYLDIYDGGKRKFEFLSLYLLPEVDAETKARNEETLQRAHQIRACLLYTSPSPRDGATSRMPSSA